MKQKMFSVAQHLVFIEEERNKIHDRLSLNIWPAAAQIDSLFSSTFVSPPIGVYRDAKLVIALGQDVEYISPQGLVKYNTAKEYLDNPTTLFRKGSGELILESQYIYSMFRISPTSVYAHYTDTIKTIDMAAKFIKMYIISLIMRDNVNNLFLYKSNINSATKSKSNYDLDFMYFFNEEVRYSSVKIRDKNMTVVHDNIVDAIVELPCIKNLLSEVTRFLELNEWCEFRSMSQDPIDNTKMLRVEAVSDRRVLLYHENCIQEINSIKADIFDGKVNDPTTIARYSKL